MKTIIIIIGVHRTFFECYGQSRRKFDETHGHNGSLCELVTK